MNLPYAHLITLSLLLLSIVPAAAAGAQTQEKPFLSHLFSSNMVLQRDRPIPIWGWTAPGKSVTVELNGNTAKATAGADGKWTAHLPAMPAGGPYALKISGDQTTTLDNVLLGDVWICSGQSNMEMGIDNVNNAQQEIAASDLPNIRLYTVRMQPALSPLDDPGAPGSDLSNQWSVCTPSTVSTGGWGGFSAAGFFFGRTLFQNLHVPIGLIHTSWGGTPAEAWTSAEALEQHVPDYKPAVAQIIAFRTEAAKGSYDAKKETDAWFARNDPGSKAGALWSDPAHDVSSWKTMQLPTNWEAAGLPDYDGVVWFRREFEAPAEAAGKDLVLHLGPIDDNDATWFNGVQVGATEGWQKPRDYNVPGSLVKAGRNVIVIRVLDTGGAGGIYGKPEQMFVEMAGQPSVSLTGPWSYRASLDLKTAPPLPMPPDQNQNHATVLFNGMVAPLLPYGIKGAIWYQGESNAGKAYQYRTLLPTMIRDWRSRWGEGDFPFLIVQLANFNPQKSEPGDDDWAELREAQLMTAQHLPHAGLAVAIDIGDAKDIHPKNKQEVGRRLALSALAKVYGQKTEYSGPVYRRMERQGSTLRLTFDHAEGGLVSKPGAIPSFAVAGADRKWYWAEEKIEGDTVILSSPQVPEPVAARYGWAVNPVCDLYNQAGLPASPFRTDDWPGITVHNR